MDHRKLTDWLAVFVVITDRPIDTAKLDEQLHSARMVRFRFVVTLVGLLIAALAPFGIPALGFGIGKWINIRTAGAVFGMFGLLGLLRNAGDPPGRPRPDMTQLIR